MARQQEHGIEQAVTIIRVWAGECADQLTLAEGADFGTDEYLVWSNELPTTVPYLWD